MDLEIGKFYGWSNKPTFHYSLDIFNNQSSYGYWSAMALKCRQSEDCVNKLAGLMREELLKDIDMDLRNVYLDCVDVINFKELAEELLMTCEINEVSKLVH